MALPNIDINAGTPPLLWSNVQEAFEKINENFTALDLATGGTAVDLSNLFTSIIPATTQTYQLGDQTHRWKSVHTGAWSSVPGSELNGLWAGAAQIKGIGLTVDLPAGSTVNGDLIIDPDKTFFKAAQVDSELRIEANEFSDTLNLLSGTAMQLVVDSSGESIEFNNTGVTAATAGLGVSVSAATGNVTFTNTGVRSLQSITALPAGRSTGVGINISGSTGDNLRITNTGVLSIQAGNAAISVSTDVATGIVDISYAAGVLAPTSGFTTIAISGDSSVNNLQSDSTADTLTFAQGYGIILSNNSATDTMTIALNQNIDIKGSVYAEDSTLLVDAANGIIRGRFIGSVFADDSSQIIDGDTGTVYGNIEATTLRTAETKIALGQNSNAGAFGIGIGNNAGQTNQGQFGIAIGQVAGSSDQGYGGVAIGVGAGSSSQGSSAVAIGRGAGGGNQGTNAIAIGYSAGNSNQPANSIVINATGTTLNGSAAGFFVDPIRSTANGRPLMYDTTTKELFSSNVLEFVGSTISTSDSSGITIDVQTTFNTDVTVENDLNVTQRLRVQGSRVINLAELKSVVSASTSFSDFQARIAALA